jgi:hypothetical protein
MPITLPVRLADLLNVVPRFEPMALHTDSHAVLKRVVAAELIRYVVIELDT